MVSKYIHCLDKVFVHPMIPHTNSYNTDLFSESRYLIGKRYTYFDFKFEFSTFKLPTLQVFNLITLLQD